MKPTRRNVEQLARQLGADIEITDKEVLIEAPAHKVWAGDEVHEQVNSTWDDEPISAVYKIAIERMLEGLIDCPFKGCDWCAWTREPWLYTRRAVRLARETT